MIEFSKRNIRTWSMLGSRRIIGVVLKEIADKDEHFVFITADVGRYYAINRFAEEHKEKLINVGIAEQNMVGIAAGLAKTDLHPMMATYATFMTSRVLDQIRVNMGLMRLNIVAVGVSGGLSEGDMSATHMGLEDIANISAIPNITILSPADCTEAVKAMLAAMELAAPVYVRLTGSANCPIVYKEDYEYKIGKANRLRIGVDVAIVATGSMVYQAILAADILEKDNISCTVLDMHTIKPLDEDSLQGLLNHRMIVTIEEHNVVGGMGSIIASYFATFERKPPQLILGINDYYPTSNSYENLLKECGLFADEIVGKIIRGLQREENLL